MIEFLIRSFLSIFLITDYMGTLSLFMAYTEDAPISHKEKAARKACFASLVIFVFFCLFGGMVLDYLGKTEGIIRILTGFLMLYSGFQMMNGSSSFKNKDFNKQKDLSIYPIATIFITGPDALIVTTLILKESKKYDFYAEYTIYGLILFILFFIYISLIFSQRLAKLLGYFGVDMLTRIFGIMLSINAAQFIYDGVKEILHIIK